MKVTEEIEEVGLKLNIQNTKIMASSPVISWQVYGKTVKQWLTLFWGGFKITADSDCSHEIKNAYPLEEKL